MDNNTPEYDIVPNGHGLTVSCHRPASHCSVSFLKHMRGMNYRETVDGGTKHIIIEQWPDCSYRMSEGLYTVVYNICRACVMCEQRTR